MGRNRDLCGAPDGSELVMGFKMALPLNLVGDGLQPAKTGRSRL
jgi:hypothetical protein